MSILTRHFTLWLDRRVLSYHVQLTFSPSVLLYKHVFQLTHLFVWHENDRTCPACLYSDEEIDFEQYSSGYSSAEVSWPFFRCSRSLRYHTAELAPRLLLRGCENACFSTVTSVKGQRKTVALSALCAIFHKHLARLIRPAHTAGSVKPCPSSCQAFTVQVFTALYTKKKTGRLFEEFLENWTINRWGVKRNQFFSKDIIKKWL